MMSHTNVVSVRQSLQASIESLSYHGFEESRLEAEVLLACVLGIDRSRLILHLEESLSPFEGEQLERLIRRRLNHEPIAYITGHKEFFGLDFLITPATLIPRPETELIVEKALELARGKPASIADVGTGCGAIAVVLAAHLPDVKVYATDISNDVLEAARENARRHGVAERIRFLWGDLLQPVDGPVDMIVANLPYISEREMSELSEDVRLHEPELALAGGSAGLDYIERLLAQASGKLNSGGAVLVEIGYDQGRAVMALARKHFPDSGVEVLADLNGHDRLVMVSR
ncbi:MAG: peptide chain release factor N(5)-glutamine methyltransferase [Dehalococcoidia bacterium]